MMRPSMKELKAAGVEYPTLPVPLLVSFMALMFSFTVDGQTTDGFVSIDCGQEKNYTDTATGLPYVYDNGFVATGENHKIPADMEKFASNEQGYHLRSFPDGTRNCYRLSVERSKKYLIRASFLYANYDKLDRIPQFDLYLDVNPRISVNLNGSRSHHFEEILAFASRKSMFVCLVNTGSGTPFISSLELRPLDDDMYPLVISNQSSVLFRRFNIQPIRNEILRYPNDSYDRMWMPYFSDSLETLSTKSNDIKPCCKDIYRPALDVLKTCGVAAGNGSTINITLEWPLLNITSRKISYVLHDADIDDTLTTDQSRNFTFFSNLWDYWSGPYEYSGYLMSYYLDSSEPDTLDDAFLYFVLRKANSSTHPPLLNAIEVYEVKELTEPSTKEEEVVAIMEVKTLYKVKMNWEGDPCAPKRLVWEGITCSVKDPISSIVSLNLPSNRLGGKISVALKDLKLLESLDLSNNNLNGRIPNFLADLPNLVFLNLSGNNLNGLIPIRLQEKSNDGILKMSLEGNPDLCYNPDECEKSAKASSNKIVIIIPIIVTSVVVVLAVIMIIIWKKKKKSNVAENIIGGQIRSRGGSFRLPSFHTDSKKLTYTELITMTSNFNTIIGKGGFGTVYHGTMNNGFQVAVKLLSLSSSQGAKEFQMEAQLLTRIHHKNLVPLVGYCNETDHLVLVYQYMAGGNLKDHLSGPISFLRTLCWGDRLRIAVEVAEGLDYLHRGCKPAIVHRDIKTSNILLSEDLDAMIADFGLSKIFENDNMTHMSTNVLGTPGYLDPEYHNTHKLNQKSDVYSFGIVLLEVITGKPAIIKNAEGTYISVVKWVELILARGDITEIVDPKLNGEYDTNSAWKAIEIASACTPSLSIQRSTMYDVVALLKECLELEITCGTRHISSNINYEDEMITGPTTR